jgi:acetylornithine deacetylase/succinyl-diaminopimelate desuccinylase-like protein
MAHALDKIESHQFAVEFNDTSRAYFEKFGAIEGGTKGADMVGAAKGDAAAIERLKKDPSMNAILRTNCVVTQIQGGHAPNALPQKATANVNCRIFPGHDQEEIRQQLIAAIADPGVTVEFQAQPETPGAPPPLSRDIMGPIEALSRDMFPGVAVIPTMAAGATDCRFLLRRVRHARRRRHHQCARAQRTHPRAVAAGRPRVPAPVDQDIRRRQIAGVGAG